MSDSSTFLSFVGCVAIGGVGVYGLTHLIAMGVERLTRTPPPKKGMPALRIVNSNSLDDALRDLRAKGVDVRAILGKKVDLTPTPETIALHAKHMALEAKLKRRRLFKEKYVYPVTAWFSRRVG